MKFGLTSEQYAYIQREVVQPLTAKGVRVYVYGSRARGDYRPFSDLDLMIEGEPTAELGLGAIRERLSKGNFPYKVDLVLHSEFAKSFNPGYQRDKVIF